MPGPLLLARLAKKALGGKKKKGGGGKKDEEDQILEQLLHMLLHLKRTRKPGARLLRVKEEVDTKPTDIRHQKLKRLLLN